MTRTAINPPSLYDAKQYGFVHAIAADGARVLHCSGQVGFNKDGQNAAPGDLAGQARQAFANLTAVLEDQGLGPSNVASLRTYVANYDVTMLDTISSAIAEFFNGATPSAQTLLGVQSLALPDLLIEVEATAVYPI